jgi:hypothetical protein
MKMAIQDSKAGRLIFHYLLTGIVTLFLFFSAEAHWGGHGKNEGGAPLNTWVMADGSILKANFSFAKGNMLFFEQGDGSIRQLPLELLSKADQQLAKFKIRRAEALNTTAVPGYVPENVGNHKFNLGLLLWSVLLLSASSFLIFSIYQILLAKWKGQSVSNFRMAFFTILAVIALYACKKTSSGIVTPPTPVVTIPKTSLGLLDSAFAGFKPAVSTRSDVNYYYVSSNGYPNHNMMIGITSWQQQVPVTQNYTGTNSWSIPLQPAYATTPLSTKSNFMKGAVAIAVNGIPIFNALNNRGEDSYMIGELDNWGGHCGRADDYHYHAAPMHLSGINGLLPIAFALDGFAVYGAKEADGSTMQSLDTCHGHTISNGVYHYHGTSNYPYVVGAMRGKVTTDPTTPAPENQILPQAFAAPLRPALTPLNGASITGFESLTGLTGYKLTYKRGTKNGYVEYSWDASNKYKFTFTDTAGTVTTANYQR